MQINQSMGKGVQSLREEANEKYQRGIHFVHLGTKRKHIDLLHGESTLTSKDFRATHTSLILICMTQIAAPGRIRIAVVCDVKIVTTPECRTTGSVTIRWMCGSR
jgi:hypothetical protein